MCIEDILRKLDNGAFLLDYGPLALTITARKQGVMLPKAALLGAQKALAEFDRLVTWLPQAKGWISGLQDYDLYAAPCVLRKMVRAVRRLEDTQFTPMAAVAGSFSELIMEEIVYRGGADEAIVNNGGDIALFRQDQRRGFHIGVMDDINRRTVRHQLVIKAGMGMFGVATSGLGGRSLTRGIASAVTVLAARASDADAAATDIANHTLAKSGQITTCLAEEIDYDTDIKGLVVVESVGQLTDDVKIEALKNGAQRAKQLYQQGVILGAVIFVQDKYTCWPENGADFQLQPYRQDEANGTDSIH